MKRFVLIAVILFASVHAADEAIKQVFIDTKIHYGPQSVSSVTENANVYLNGTQVSGQTFVNGNLTTQDASCNDVVVNGDAVIINSTISGYASIYGNIELINSQLNVPLTTYAQNVLLIGSTTSSITVKKNVQPQVITIQSGSRVNGTITFESGNGQVITAGNSYVTGAVVGGKTQRMN